MCNRKFLLLFLLILFQLKAFSAVFVVTSNADSGPGTLRDALTQAAANGVTGIDYINFNLPGTSLAARTITLVSNLPLLSSNLVIDGTTQGGASFGVSNAKVKIVNTGNNAYMFKGDNIGDFSVSGIWMVVGINSAVSFNESPPVDVTNSGNVIVTNCLVQTGGVTVRSCQEFTLQSSFIGYLSDGITAYDQNNVYVYSTKSTIIGGGITQGNLICGGITLLNGSLPEWSYNVSYNKLGTDYTGTTSTASLFDPNGRINAGNATFTNSGVVQGVISNNLIENFVLSGISVEGKGNVLITGNCINTDPARKINFALFGFRYWQYGPSTGIYVGEYTDAIIGGSNPGDANILGYLSEGVIEQFAGQVVITQNSMFCIDATFFDNVHGFFQNPTHLVPVVLITSITATSVSGTATPGARVELFYNDDSDCPLCNPKYYLTYVTADSQGNWSYTGAIPSNVIASAIFENETSLFTRAILDIQQLKVTQPTCGHNDGSITGIKFYNAGGGKWVDQDGKIIANTTDVYNLAPGTYKFEIGSAECGAQSDWITIIDPNPKIDATNAKTLNAACNKNGSISGIKITSGNAEKLDISWVDENNQVIGTTADISNLSPGKYTLNVTGETYACTATYGPLTITNAAGLTIDQSQQQIQPTNCGQSTGSITNIQVSGGTGSYQYVWLNSQQQQVGTNQNLTGQPAGVYKLQVTDGGQCGPVYSADITIPETNGITLDESKAVTTSASCNLNNGSVNGIAVAGAIQYIWVDANGKSYTTTTPDLANAPAGTYILTASNGTGCSKNSQAYHIGQNAPIQFQLGMDNSINIECTPLITAGITLTAPDPRMSSFRWVNSQNQTIGTGLTITNLQPGTYQLYITDENGCENYYSNYVVPPYSQLAVTASTDIANEKCGLKNGSIGATNITGGIPPYTYTWTDNSGTLIGTGSTIANLAAGSYTLSIANGPCGNINIPYVVGEDSEDIPLPSVSDVQLCSSGSVLLSVNNPSATTTYRLYDDENGIQPLAEQTGGRFNVTVSGNRSYFISQLNGTCESRRAEVKVTVGLSTLNIANTFTPNGDGINDYWQINNIENYPNAIVQVFNRYGQKLFESKGYSKPFDGTYSGKQLAAGVYYYIINLSTNCNLLSGSLTIVR